MLLLYSQIIGLLGKSCTHFIWRIATYPEDKIICSLNNWGQFSKPWHNLRPKYVIFGTLFQAWPLKFIPIDLVSRIHSLPVKSIAVSGHIRFQIFRPKWLKSMPYFRPKLLKNHTLWYRTYLYSLYR